MDEHIEPSCQDTDAIASTLAVPAAETIKYLHNVIEQLPAALLVIDNQGYISLYNAQASVLLNEPLQNELWIDIIKREFITSAYNNCEMQLRNSRVVTIATQSLGAMPGQLILINDVTEKASLRQQLNHSQRLSSMGKMAASLAHQLRTPLTTALLYSDNLTKPKLSANKRQEFAAKLINSMRSMERQIKDMLLLAKGSKLVKSEIKLADLLNNLLQQCSPLLAEKRAELKLSEAIPPCSLLANPDALLGALQNCIQNAIEAQDMATITIETKLIDSILELSIVDQGPGISEQDLLQVESPFYTTKINGTGLGLAVAKTTAESLGGELQINSKVGHGTRVTFKLPILESNNE